ncbi:uncharacterized protein EV420DRAFT_1651475 [Desarmillaria tabescens]|uniref:Uncharacterized protein n=1 Tax=Armillaria tabescens TaxID=1929756 RepID=A0AA39JAC4_ARMTA|nr:uncharacterized protein EV420DRAFT_1651475 [Desarmillaria tabescens]KAK0438330.1 hypothetical protein EV420DRAFT_1651475 [Desarmillaria tabescens]
MSRSIVSQCISAVKLIQAAGDMAPFPYIKGLANVAVVLLELLEKADKNNADLIHLSNSLSNTLVVVRDTVIAHGESSAQHFREFCVEVTNYLATVLNDLNSIKRSKYTRGIRQYLQTNDICDKIDEYKQRIRVTTETRFIASEVNDYSIAIEDALRTLRHDLYDIHEETRTRCRRRALYQDQIYEIMPCDISMKQEVFKHTHEHLMSVDIIDYYSEVDTSASPKLVRVYRARRGSEVQAVKMLYDDLHQFLSLRHPNIPQLFGVCTSSSFPALIFHQNAARKKTVEQHRSSLALLDVLNFDLQLMSDMRSASMYLQDFEGIREWIVGPDTTYVDGNGRVIYDNFCPSLGTDSDAWLRSVFHLLETNIRRPSYNFSHPRWKSLIKSLQIMQSPSFIHKDNLLPLYEMIYAFVVGKECIVDPERRGLYAGGHIIRENIHDRPSSGTTHVASLPLDLEPVQWTFSDLGMRDNEDIIPVEGIRVKWKLSNLRHWVCVRPSHLAFPDAPGSRHGQKSIEHLVYAWFAQCSQLTTPKCLIDALLLDVEFMVNVDWRFGHQYDVFQLCDTFIASDVELTDDIYLCIYPPSQRDEPEFRWSLDPDIGDSVSHREAWSVLGIDTQIYAVYTTCKLFTDVYKDIQDLHRACGFDS